MNALAAGLLWGLVQVTAVTAAAAVLYAAAWRAGPRVRGSVALAGLLVAAGLTVLAPSPWPRWGGGTETASISPDQIRSSTSPVAESPLVVSPAKPRAGGAGDGANPDPASLAATHAFLAALLDPPAGPDRPTPARRPVRWGLIAAASLVLLGVVRFAVGWLAVRRLRRAAVPVDDADVVGEWDALRTALSCRGPVDLRESPDLSTAAAVGGRRPAVLLPADWRTWTAAERSAVLAHELAHVRRGDAAANLFAQAALTLQFYHPLSHWLLARLRLEQEWAADAAAAAVAGGRETYLKSLAGLALRNDRARPSWPARAFLPTRRTFLRRVEMLRSPAPPPARCPRLTRTACLAAVLGCGVLAAGFRPVPAGQPPRETDAPPAPPASNTDSSADPAPTDPAPATTAPSAPPIDPVLYVPPFPQLLLSVDVRQFRMDPRLAPLRDLLADGPVEEVVRRTIGVSPLEADRLVLFAPEFIPGGTFDARIVVRTTGPATLPATGDDRRVEVTPFGPMVRTGDDTAVVRVDERTLLVGSQDGIAAMILKAAAQDPERGEPWARALAIPGTAVVELRGHGAGMKEFQERTGKAITLGDGSLAERVLVTAAAPLFRHPLDGLNVDLSGGNTPAVQVRGTFMPERPADPATVDTAMSALATLLRIVGRMSDPAAGRDDGGRTATAGIPAVLRALAASARVESALADPGMDEAGSEAYGFYSRRTGPGEYEVSVHADLNEDAVTGIAALLRGAVDSAVLASTRSQDQTHLKRIALALFNYESTYKHFPPAVIVENGVKRSWRVELLPYLDEAALFLKYRTDEPWDSPANLEVLKLMPDVYRQPGTSIDDGETPYLAVVAKPDAEPRRQTAWLPEAEGTRDPESRSPKGMSQNVLTTGRSLADFRDGTTTTLLLVSADRGVPWTKPEDVTVDLSATVDPSAFGGVVPGGFNAAFGDGSVKFVPEWIDAERLSKFLTRAGGELVEEIPLR